MRLPTHLEVSGLIRSVEAAGGFAAVLHKGERDAGSLVIVTINRDGVAELFERMPQLDGSRNFISTKIQAVENKHQFDEYLQRRSAQDSDLWVVEVDIADAERFIATLAE